MYKVLLADDEPLILAGLRRKIDWESLGFTIIGECTDGAMLLEAIRRDKPDLLLVDIQMPQATGLDVLRAIQNFAPVASIVISGYSDFAYAQEALRYGVIDYLLKPVSSATLQGAVLRAKQRLDAGGPGEAGLWMRQIRAGLHERRDGSSVLALLSLSGGKRFYWVFAFHGPCRCLTPREDETALVRYDDETTVAVVHTDRGAECCARYLAEHFSFDTDAGVAKPIEQLTQLPRAADEAFQLLEMRRIRRGVHLWPTENEEGSLDFFLHQADEAFRARDGVKISALLRELPAYAVEHRFSVKSVERLYNSYMARFRGDGKDAKLLRYMTWEEMLAAYPTVDELLSAMYAVFAPDGLEDGGVTAARAIVFKIKMLLQRDYAQPISLQDMAAKFHIDMSYLSSVFHEEVGETFTNYLTGIRVRHACEYLATTNLPHSKVAQLCGFNSDSYMKKVFRKVLNMTPSAYRSAKRESGGAPPQI